MDVLFKVGFWAGVLTVFILLGVLCYFLDRKEDDKINEEKEKTENSEKL